MRKGTGEGGLFLEKEQWSFFHGKLTFPERGRAARGGGPVQGREGRGPESVPSKGKPEAPGITFGT